MPKFSDLRIITKVACCFLLLGAVIGGAIWFASERMAHTSEVYSKIIENDVEVVIRTQRAMRADGAVGRRLAAWRRAQGDAAALTSGANA